MTPGLQRATIAAVQVMGLAVWFSMSAVVPSLRVDWGISDEAGVWLTASVQLGFVVGAIGSTALTLPDRIPPQLLLGASAGAAAGSTLVLALAADSMAVAIPLRALTGICLAGVYPVGMKLMVSWSGNLGRGRALGLLLGALTVGSLLPQLMLGVDENLPWRGVLIAAATLGMVGALTAVLLLRPGPHLATSPAPANLGYALTMFRQRGPFLANLGYFGHMWELYALWTWAPTFLVVATSGAALSAATGIIVFLTVGVAGAVGCLLGGWGADRYGRSPAAVAALTVSGGCCLLSPFVVESGIVLIICFMAIWGASAIADSGVFSTALAETADARYVGTALTMQTAVGFALTVVSIQLVPVLAGAVGWRFAFLLLAPGPVIGAVAMRAFRTERRATATSPTRR